MELMKLGGPMMWPLLAASIAAFAIIIERFIFLGAYKVPKSLRATSSRSEAAAACSGVPVLAEFAKLLSADRPNAAALEMTGAAVVADMENRLGILASLAKTSTLMGLLGTILGMISTFSAIAGASAGVDMGILAEGLWQALITTAAGLFIAIPSFIASAVFEAKVKRMADALTLAANIAVIESEGGGRAERASTETGGAS